MPLFALSLGAVLLQFGYAFLVTRIAALIGPSATIFPIIVVGIALAELAYARQARERRWLR